LSKNGLAGRRVSKARQAGFIKRRVALLETPTKLVFGVSVVFVQVKTNQHERQLG